MNATWLGPEFLLPRSSLPAAVSVLPLMVKIDTEPSLRLAVSASVPDGLIDTPVTPGPACRVCVTAGGLALRSMTEMRSSGAVFFGSAGSTFMAEVTIAKLSSFETATLCGTPTTLLGACTSPNTFGGDTPMSRIVTVSGGGLAGTVFCAVDQRDLVVIGRDRDLRSRGRRKQRQGQR